MPSHHAADPESCCACAVRLQLTHTFGCWWTTIHCCSYACHQCVRTLLLGLQLLQLHICKEVSLEVQQAGSEIPSPPRCDRAGTASTCWQSICPHLPICDGLLGVLSSSITPIRTQSDEMRAFIEAPKTTKSRESVNLRVILVSSVTVLEHQRFTQSVDISFQDITFFLFLLHGCASACLLPTKYHCGRAHGVWLHSLTTLPVNPAVGSVMCVFV